MRDKTNWRKTTLAERREDNITARYGMIVDAYEALNQAQNGRCAICGGLPKGNRSKRLYIDHDHATGRIRGLLCITCNSGLGQFQDKISLMETAIAYLRRGQE